jgi:hypothetical protein
VSHRSPALILGCVYHETLANALRSLKEGDEVTEDALALWFDSLWKDELESSGPPIKWTSKLTATNQRELGIALVRAWYAQAFPLYRDAEIVAVEFPFRIPIVNPMTGEVTERPLDGVIDLLLGRPGGVTIIDHKTCKQKFSNVEIELGLQASGYVMAAREMSFDDVRFEFHTMSKSLKSPKFSVVPAPRDDDDIARLHWVASQAEKLLDAGVYMPASPGWQCAGCEYGKACRKVHNPPSKPARKLVSAA